MKNKIITVLFSAFIAVCVLITAVLPDRQFSDSERRVLQSFPAFSLSKLIDGSFMSDMSDYISDQFMLRDAWISIRTGCERLLGKTDSNGVYFAKDGYLIEQFDEISMTKYNQKLSAVKQFCENYPDIASDVMLVPTASAVLSEKLPAFAPEIDQLQLIEAAKDAGLSVSDVSSALISKKDEYIYYRTDHHWTSLGAYYAYREWRAQQGLDTADISEYTAETLCDDFRGTTYAKVNEAGAEYDAITAYYMNPNRSVSYNFAAYETDSIYERSYLDTSDKYSVFINSNQGICEIDGDGDDGTLLIIKDSYANCFTQFAVSDYSKVVVIDLRYFPMELSKYIENNRPEHMLILYNLVSFAEDTNIYKLLK